MYGKLFASTFTGSMFGAGPDRLAVWAYVIAHAVDSRVELNSSLLAAVLGMSTERVDAAIAWLCRPDAESRNPVNDGRRLVKEGAYQYFVTSHEKYKSIRSEDDRRAYNREKQRESRARRKVKRDVIDNQSKSAMSAHTEADTEADTEAEAEKTRTAARVNGRIAKPQPLVARRRRDAAWEGPRVYVPQRAHSDFIGLRNHPGAEAELLAWYAQVSDTWTTGLLKDAPIDADMFVFWRARFGERWPVARPAAKSREPQWVLDARASQAAGDA